VDLLKIGIELLGPGDKPIAMKIKIYASSALLCLSAAPAALAISGGGFEVPPVPGGAPYLVGVTPAGWTGTGDIALQGYAGSTPSGEGNQWFDLNPSFDAGTGISQMVSLTGGISYTFSFVYNGGGGGSTTEISYSIGSLVSGSVSTASMDTYSGTPWALFSTTFTPSSSNSELLRFTPNGSWSGGFIDDVRLAAGGTTVPDAGSSILLLSCAFTCAAGTRRWLGKK